MSFVIGRLSLDDPESFPESVGESVAAVGATAVPGGRAGLTTSVGLTSFPASTGDTAADRARVRRQLRSILNNLPYRLQGVYVAWSEDTEQSGWYVPGSANFDVADVSGLVSSFWRFAGVEVRLNGRRRTHRRATAVYARSLLDGTVPRDYLRRVYSTNFSDQTPVVLTHLPSTVTDYRIKGEPTPTLTTARTGYGSSSLQAVIGGTELQVVSYEQDEANRNLGDVVLYDRRGTLTLTTTGPTTGWEEVYGPDWPLTSGDAPVIENSLARVSYDTSNTDGFILERWIGSTWSQEGKVCVKRITTGGGTLDTTFVSADVCEWTPERGVIRTVMSVSGDTYSREEVYVTLQRGWTGPRVEVYPAEQSTGTTGKAGVAFYAGVTPAGTSYARKEDDAGLQTATGFTAFSNATLGSATGFNDENWMAFHPNGGGAGAGTTQVNLAVVQSDIVAKTYSDTSAYGSTRNGVGVEGGTAYCSVHFGFVTATGGTLNENSSTTRLGSQDLGAQVLTDSRSIPTLVPRVEKP
jgi:hypothetical protein